MLNPDHYELAKGIAAYVAVGVLVATTIGVIISWCDVGLDMDVAPGLGLAVVLWPIVVIIGGVVLLVGGLGALAIWLAQMIERRIKAKPATTTADIDERADWTPESWEADAR